MFAGLQI